LNRSLDIGTTASQVPYQRLNKGHATSMPDATGPELRCPSDFSQDDVEILVLTSVAIIDTSSMVHSRSSPLLLPYGINFRLFL